MKSSFGRQAGLAATLLILSGCLYFIHYKIFHDWHHIGIYLLGDIAFLPIEVLLVTMVLHRILVAREKQQLMKKMNMVIGAFFSEVGTRLLKYFCAMDPAFSDNAGNFLIGNDWTKKDFARARRTALRLELNTCISRTGIRELNALLLGKRQFLLMLLENPNLLEHDSFTDLLWAVFHLSEELAGRKDAALGEKDQDHLCIDVKRAYRRLVREWLLYMEHLKEDYPYLFSFALRTNPFNSQARVEVT